VRLQIRGRKINNSKRTVATFRIKSVLHVTDFDLLLPGWNRSNLTSSCAAARFEQDITNLTYCQKLCTYIRSNIRENVYL
jgi:hypothetical protein